MKTVVIGDLHHKTRWVEDFLKSQEPYDEVVFVGDYFDDFGDNAFTATGTALWLRESLQHANRIHLIGNHDLPYALDVWNELYYCPGYTKEKKAAINDIMTPMLWDKIVGAYYTQGYLISHAGFDATLVMHPVLGMPTPEELVKQANIGLLEARKGNRHKLYLAGYRMATNDIGGIIWSDWNNEYVPIHGIPQIVGHTPGHGIRTLQVNKEQSDYCVDCNTAMVLVITDGKLSIIRRSQKVS